MSMQPSANGTEVRHTITGCDAAALVPAVFITSLGCRTNQEECSALAHQLQAGGLQVVDEVNGQTDIIIFNTCAVTAAAESKTRHRLALLARMAPRARILVTGCYAQHQPHFFQELPNVHWVVGNGFKDDICAIISRGDRAVVHDAQPRRLQAPDPRTAVPDPLHSGRTRFSLKIQEGCDFSCAYCIVPRLRGPSRCVARGAVVAAAVQAQNAGFHELVLTGTHIGQYRDDDGCDTAGLIEEVLASTSRLRVRISSLDPRDLTPGLIALLGHGRICNHLHLSVQSLCPQTLALMNRGTTDLPRLHGVLDNIRHAVPGINVGADFIVGFPGESETMFETTLEALESFGMCYGHVFRFSPRSGTPAASMTRQIDENEKSRRAAALRERLARLRLSFLHAQLATRQEIIVEQESPACGLSANYLRLTLPQTTLTRNTRAEVTVTAINERGELLARHTPSSEEHA